MRRPQPNCRRPSRPGADLAPGGLLVLAFVLAAALASAPGHGRAGAAAAAVRQGETPVLDPKTYASPSGEYTLYVNPRRAEGSGAAGYRMRRRGAVVWEGTRPFTLWEAGVADDGTVGGYAYSHGAEGSGGASRPGDFAVIVLDPAGATRLHRKAARAPSRFLHEPPDPLANGLIMDGANDRMIVRVRDPDVNRRHESWRVYRLSTGREVRRFAPKPLLGEAREASRTVLDAKAVAGTPLVLAHWWRYDERTGDVGARFTLHDVEAGDGAPVWSLVLPHDYAVPGDEAAEDRLRDEIRASGAILSADAPGRFSLRFAADRQRATFAVARGEGRETWRVEEVGTREPYALPPPAADPAFAAPMLRPRRALAPLVLRAPASGSPPAIRRVYDLTGAGPGRFAFLRRDAGATDLVVVDQRRGAVLRTLPLRAIPLPGDGRLSGLVWQGGDRFVVFAERGKDTVAYRADARTKALSPLAGFRCAPMQDAAAFPGGDGFVVLTFRDEVIAYDAAGRTLWRRADDEEGGGGRPDALVSMKSATVLKDGTVAVLGGVGDDAVHLLSRRTGRPARPPVVLRRAWRREGNYPSDLFADPAGGGFVVHDFQGTPALVRMSAAGRVVGAGVVPRDTVGTRITHPRVAVGADGRLWVSDTHALLRLGADGRPDRILGEPPENDRLREIAEVAVTPSGRILARDARTDAAHVFDHSGRWLHACAAPPPGDRPSFDILPRLEVGPDDRFSLDGRWFGADGRPGAKPPGFRSPRARVARLARRPDATWLGYVHAFAATSGGALAVLDLANRERFVPPGGAARHFASLYAADDTPRRVLRLPDLSGAYPAVAYDGRTLVVSGPGRAVAYRAATGQALWQFPYPTPGDDADPWQPFLTDDGRTLALFDNRRTLHRYALP